MVRAHDLPHGCESYELTELLAGLGRQRLRVLRSYVWQVELGESDVTSWLAKEDCPISRAAWYKDSQRNYLRDPLFSAALDAYKRRALVWQSDEEAKAVQLAQRKIRLNAPRAAEKMLALLDAGDERVSLEAAKTTLDRAGVETASKQKVQVAGSADEPLRVVIEYADSESDST